MTKPVRTMALIRFFIFCSIFIAAPIPGSAVKIEEIPSPRPAGWVVDLTGTLPAATVADLNRVSNDVKAQGGGELAVVVVGSTEGEDPRRFATRLFNTWGIGEAGRDNGLLVFAALDDRAAEIILGSGIDGDVQVRRSDEIMQTMMVPRFREGDPAGAILQGSLACVSLLLDAASATGGAPAVAQSLDNPSQAEPAPGFSAGQILRRLGSPLWLGLLALAGAVSAWFAVRAQRRCTQCRTQMLLLDESADDTHLSAAEKLEEELGSVDHDILICQSCGAVKKLRRGRFLSRYANCPRCSAKTLSSTSTTLRAADYQNGGLVQVDEKCAHCAHTASYTRATPRLHRRTSSRSFSSGSSSRSSGSSGFGGGRSSGRGSSGRW